ncbi:hypothetical protein [Rubellicoccus peritrichatus]|uniref:Uncharacterized protein n=1 Tax=Rubellicoccus peritrichatus TaxID=3080537 RepID=A0AAQ3LD52_9BACT|nr:hypothetical protein [Puniceicoccus sp. CR14]WOO42307.1 hypothetical protein RZN69_04340 [Puniceicoccus sp. CR14]
MRKAFAIAALICGILGLLAGLNEWFLQQYVLWHVNWEGPLQTLSDISWLFEGVLISLAVIFLAIAVMQDRPVEAYYEPAQQFSTPPPMITPAPVNPPPLTKVSDSSGLDFSVPTPKKTSEQDEPTPPPSNLS